MNDDTYRNRPVLTLISTARARMNMHDTLATVATVAIANVIAKYIKPHFSALNLIIKSSHHV